MYAQLRNGVLMLAGLLLAGTAMAATYAGNGNDGSGGAVGGGSLGITRAGDTLTFTLTPGAGDLNDTVVIYLDSLPGGFASTEAMDDDLDLARRAISGGTTCEVVFGFFADFAIVFDAANGGLLYGLANGGNNSLNHIGDLGGAGFADDPTFVFTLDLADIGAPAAHKFQFVATYVDPSDAGEPTKPSRSDEAIGDSGDLGAGNPGVDSTIAFTASRPYSALRLNEVNFDQDGTDNDEFFEIAGGPGEALDGLSLIVIGDGPGGDGVLDEALPLDGYSIPADGFMVVGQTGKFSLGTPDYTVDELHFENNDNFTYLLVRGSTASRFDDLDTNDDGTLDSTPWTEELDRIAALKTATTPPTGTEWAYGPPNVGPVSVGLLGYFHRCGDVNGTWVPGLEERDIGDDTPGEPNLCPQIAVRGNNTPIFSGDTTPSLLDHTDFGAALANNAAASRVFRIANTGNAKLTLTGAMVEITGAAAFTVSVTPASDEMNPGTHQDFEITFAPTAVETSVATVTISSDDADENPFTFTVTGVGHAAAAAEVSVLGNNTVIADGSATPMLADHTDFGGVDVDGGTAVRVFTIANAGSAELTVGDVTITGAGAADFTVTTNPASPVAIGDTTTVRLTFDPSAAGSREAMVSIVNNDADEGPYDFAIKGFGIVPLPEIDIIGNGVSIADDDTVPTAADHTDFGKVSIADTTVVRTFTIRNTGDLALALTGAPDKVTITGTGAADFTVTAVPDSPVAIDGQTTFEITFDPGAVGVSQATVSIANDDTDENPYDFAIRGTGATPTGDCGDGVFSTVEGEVCDDGNTVGGDGCSSNCKNIEPGFRCSTPGSPCETTCGDGFKAGKEQCDAGSNNSNILANACRLDCSAPSCGDGVVDSGEACDHGGANDDVTTGACLTDCSGLVGGDGTGSDGSGGCHSTAHPNASGGVVSLLGLALLLAVRRRRLS